MQLTPFRISMPLFFLQYHKHSTIINLWDCIPTKVTVFENITDLIMILGVRHTGCASTDSSKVKPLLSTGQNLHIL